MNVFASAEDINGYYGRFLALELPPEQPSDDCASVAQDSVIAWNIVLGVAVMLWAFGYTQTKAMLTKNGRKQEAAET